MNPTSRPVSSDWAVLVSRIGGYETAHEVNLEPPQYGGLLGDRVTVRCIYRHPPFCYTKDDTSRRHTTKQHRRRNASGFFRYMELRLVVGRRGVFARMAHLHSPPHSTMGKRERQHKGKGGNHNTGANNSNRGGIPTLYFHKWLRIDGRVLKKAASHAFSAISHFDRHVLKQ